MPIYALKGELSGDHLEVQRAFVNEWKILCSPFVTVRDVMKADSL